MLEILKAIKNLNKNWASKDIHSSKAHKNYIQNNPVLANDQGHSYRKYDKFFFKVCSEKV